jgi:four helix bundle protein
MAPAGSNFRDLHAWRAARRLVKSVYTLTDSFPAHEQYCLTQQMRRAAHSVHSNIAEGDGRLSKGEWIQFLGHARGSLMELESHLIAAFDLAYCSKEQAKEIAGDIKRSAQLVNGLLRASMRKDFDTKKYGPQKSRSVNG